MARTVVCGDALRLLPKLAPWEGAVVTSLPDPEEMTFKGVREWQYWFIDAIHTVFDVDARYVVFYQTDRRKDGVLLSKAEMILAAGAGWISPHPSAYSLLWHKIVLTRPPASINLFRPAYSHVIGFGREARSGRAWPDVVYSGPKLYPNGMGIEATSVILTALRERGVGRVLDPFCGRGTVLAVADSLGLDSYGIDIDAGQCRAARKAKV